MYCEKFNFQIKFRYILFMSQSINRHVWWANVRQSFKNGAILCLNSRALPLRFICYFIIFCSLFTFIFDRIFPREQNHRVRRDLFPKETDRKLKRYDRLSRSRTESLHHQEPSESVTASWLDSSSFRHPHSFW